METHVTDFTPLMSALGGGLIGLSAVVLMATIGRIAGLSGITAGILPQSLDRQSAWKAAFIVGAVLAPVLLAFLAGYRPQFSVPVGYAALIGGGILVGLGVTLGSGCTSGHGVCGIARLSGRSIVATAIFMATTGATVFVTRHVLGV